MSNTRARVDFPRTEQGLVDKFIGTAYDRMLAVYEHIDAFEDLYEVLLEIEDVATYVANKKVDAAIKEMVAYLQDLELRMVDRIKEEGDKYTNKFDEYVKYIEDLVSNIRTDFIVQETGSGKDVAMSQDASTRELFKKWDIQKTQGKGDLVRYSLLKDVEDNARSEHDNIYTVIDRVDEKRITSERELKVELADSKASISRVEDVMVTEFRAQAEVNTNIESSLGDAKGSITTIEKTMATNSKAQASKNEALESSIRGNTATINKLSETVATDREATATQVNELKAEVRDSKASITDLSTVVSNDRRATANKFSEVESSIGSNTASITSMSETVATNHQVSVNQYNTLKGEVDQNFGLIDELNDVIVANDSVTAQKITELKTELNKNIETETGKVDKKLTSEITRVDKAVSDLDKSTAEANLNLKTEVNSSITTVDKKVDSNKNATDASITKNKNDAVKEANDFTIQSVSVVDTKVTSEINQINKTISEMDNASAESVTQLKSELEREITTTNTKIETNKKESDDSIDKAKKDAVADSKEYTDQQITVVNTKIGSEITNVNKTITELEKTSAESTNNLISELESTTTVTNKKIDKVQADIEKEILDTVEIKDTRNNNELPSWYYANYPRREVKEFKSVKVMGIKGITAGYADLTTVVPWRDNSGGNIYQTINFNGSLYNRYGGEKGKPDTWSEWVQGESTLGSQAKANKAKSGAIADSKKYTDAETKKVDTKVSAEIKQTNTTVAKVTGEVSAMTRMTATTTANGKKVVTGLQFGSNGTTSDFKIMADKFSVVSTDGTAEMKMFTAKKVGNKTEFVVNGKIKADQVEAGKLSGMEISGGSLNVGNGKFKVSPTGVVDIKANTTKNVGMQITNERIDVYDEKGVLRVRLGKLN